MMRVSRFAAVVTALLLVAVSSSGQDRTTWRTAVDIQEGSRGSVVGTVADVDEARNEVVVEIDDDPSGPRVVALSDSVSTQYAGFGGVINGSPEIFVGTQGLANVRVGDRVEIRGVGRANHGINADMITLRGRQVAASQTGVGTSRPLSTPSTPNATRTNPSDRVGPVDGVVQEVNAADGRIVIVTDRREIMTVRTSGATPVYYKGETFRVANLEVGDRVRIDPDGSGGVGGELRARSISVTQSSQEGTATPKANLISGRVARVDRALDIVTLDNGKTAVRVDVGTATDSVGRRVRALDFRTGDRVEITGRFSPTAADLFIASTVRFSDEPPAQAPPRDADTGGPAGTSTDVYANPAPAMAEMAAVTIYGTVRETLDQSPRLVVRDSGGRMLPINVLEDFVVRGRTGTTTADKLKVGDAVVIKAFRDYDGNYIAQTIRVR